MATYDDPYNPIPRRLREPTPGYSQTRLPGTERTVVETPRGGFSPDPADGLSERDLTPENYAMPFSPTRSMRYGPGDERDLGAPVVDPRSPLAPSPARWGSVTTRRVNPRPVQEPSELDRVLATPGISVDYGTNPSVSTPGKIRVPVGDESWRVYTVGTASEIDAEIAAAKRRVADWESAQKNPPAPRYVNAARDSRGGYAYSVTDAPLPSDQSTPRPLFSGVAGEDFEATRRRGEQVAKLMRETDGPFANPNDWNYVRSYGPRAAAQAVASGRANISGADPALVAQERERFLRNRTTDLSISPQLRSAARDELAQIERDAAEERRREMWAAEQAARLRMAEIAGPTGAADNSWRTEVARIEQETQLRVKELENQGLDRRQAQDIAARERVQKLQNEGNLSVAQTQAQGRTDAATATAQGRVDAAAATAEGRVKAAGIRADATKYASDNTYKAAADASAARVEAAKAAGLSEQQVAQIRAESQERIAKLSQDGALARAGIQADAQKYISDNAYAARADAAAAAVEAAMATADARVSAERVRAEGARLLAAENPWVALGGGVMGNRQTGDQAGRPNATAAAAKPQIFKMKGADGTERLVRPREDGAGVEVLFEDPDAALVIAEQEVRNLESDKLRYGRTTAQREGYDERIAEAKARLAALREARRSAPDYEGPTGQAPTNDAADGWAAFGGIVR